MKLLLVDDEKAIRSVVSAVLEMHGFHIDTAASAGEAKQILHAGRFDVVLTDLRMETETAGFEVVSAAAQLAPRPRIVILTACPVPAAVWRPMGADALVQKGASPVDLVNLLKRLTAPQENARRS